MKKWTNVMNVITEEKSMYYNDLSLEENLVSAIISSTEDSRKLLEYAYRNEINYKAKIEMISSLNGCQKAYSPVFDMIAYEQQ